MLMRELVGHRPHNDKARLAPSDRVLPGAFLFPKLRPETKHGSDRKSSSAQNEHLKAFVKDTR